MNRRGAEIAEKKKKGSPSHRLYLKFLAMAVVIFLVGFLANIAIGFFYNQQRYKHNRRLWDEGNYGGAVFPYVYGYADGSIHASAHGTNSDDLWDMAFDCVQRVFCTIRYNEQYHYPEYIYPKYNEMLRIDESIQVRRILFCSDEENYQICEMFLPKTHN